MKPVFLNSASTAALALAVGTGVLTLDENKLSQGYLSATGAQAQSSTPVLPYDEASEGMEEEGHDDYDEDEEEDEDVHDEDEEEDEDEDEHDEGEDHDDDEEEAASNSSGSY